MTLLESGTYSLFSTPTGTVIEVFNVTEVTGPGRVEPDMLETGWYWQPLNASGVLSDRFDTREAALADAAAQ